MIVTEQDGMDSKRSLDLEIPRNRQLPGVIIGVEDGVEDLEDQVRMQPGKKNYALI